MTTNSHIFNAAMICALPVPILFGLSGFVVTACDSLQSYPTISHCIYAALIGLGTPLIHYLLCKMQRAQPTTSDSIFFYIMAAPAASLLVIMLGHFLHFFYELNILYPQYILPFYIFAWVNASWLLAKKWIREANV